MIRIPKIAVLAALLAAAPVRAASHHPGPRPEQVHPAKTKVSAPVEIEMGSAYNRPTVQVMIDGKGPFRFLVDSGAGTTVINADLAKEIGLEIVDSTRVGDPMNPQAIRADVVRVPSLSIGGAVFEEFQAASWDRAYLGRGGKDDPRGVIGFPVFHDVLLTFDYVDHKLRIAPGDLPKPDGKTVLAYEAPMGIPEFTVKIGDIDVKSHLDTGSGGFFSVPKSYKDQLKFSGPLVEVGRGRTVNTEMVIRGALLEGAVSVGQYRWEKPFVVVSDELPMGNLGGTALASFAITFDQRAQAMRFEQKAPLVSPPMPQPKAPVQNASAPPPPGSGLRFAGHPGSSDLEVYDVAPGSPAAKAGVTAGEKLLEINGASVASLSDDQRRAAFRASPLKLKLAKDGVEHEVTIVFP